MSASPSAAATPVRLRELPCQRDPDRWFDRTDRTHALAGCLSCPARSWCAREALTAEASFGMWAGIWIDRGLADVANYLQAIAESAPPTTPPPAPKIHRMNAPRRPRVIRPPATHTTAAVITARSSGHCEIMASGCRLTLDAIVSRLGGRPCDELPDAAAGYAICRTCQATVTRMEPRLSHQLGYLIDSPATAVTAAFYWRQSRWMLLDSAGGAAPCSLAQRSA